MDTEEAQKVFAKYLKITCSECGSLPGQLCASRSVWVHLDRMLDNKKTLEPRTGGIPWGEDLQRDCREMKRLESWGIFPGGYHDQNCSIH